MSFLNDLRQAVSNYAASSAPNTAQLPVTVPPAPIPSPLDWPVQVKLDGSGNGTAAITPPGARMGGQTWDVSNVFVSAATNVNEAQATIYFSRGIQSTSPTDALGQTATGSSGDTYSNAFTARPGDWITVKWSGGDAGAIATMTVKGSVNIP